MHILFVTGSDTGIGKTRVAAAAARLLWKPGLRIQLIKPLETGRGPDAQGDAENAASASGIEDVTTFTFAQFPLPIAPLAAARAAHSKLSLPFLLDQWRALPPADLRIVEGAGGLAVPIDSSGLDWADFATAIGAHRVILVIADRLGAINQGRLVSAYALSRGLPGAIWLNEVRPETDAIRESNREGLASLPICATQRFDHPLPENADLTRRFILETES